MTTEARLREDSARVAGNAAALLLSKGLTSVLLLGWQVVLARTLGVDDYGIYGTIGALMAVAGAVPDFGIGTIVVRDVARRPSKAGSYFNASLALSLSLATAGYAVAQIAAMSLGYSAALRAMLWFVGLNLAVDAVGTASHTVLVATERIQWTAALAVAHVVVLVTCGALALAAGGGLWAVYVAMFAAAILRSIGYLVVARRSAFLSWQPVDMHLARYIIAAGAPLGIAALLSLGFAHADKLASTAILGASATGQLTAAFVIVFGIVELFGTTVLVAASPSMSRMDSERDAGSPMPVLARLLSLDVLLGVPLSLVLVIFGSSITTMIFGLAFESAGVVLRVMGWCVLVRMMEGALAQALTVQSAQTKVLAARAGGLALNLATTIALLPRIGIAGAAYGVLSGESMMVVAMLALLRPPRIWWTALGRRTSRMVLPILGLGVALMTSHGRLPTIVAVAGGFAVYGGLVMVAKAITADDRRLLMRVAWFEPADIVARWWSQP